MKSILMRPLGQIQLKSISLSPPVSGKLAVECLQFGVKRNILERMLTLGPMVFLMKGIFKKIYQVSNKYQG